VEWSTFWAVISVVVSVCAAVFAERAAAAAESSAASALRANDIEMHRERLAIYKALLQLHHELTTQGNGLNVDAIDAFYQPYTLSEFYYPAAQFNELEAVRDDAYALNRKYFDWWYLKREGSDVKASAALDELNQRRKALDERIKAAKEDLRGRLRLDPSYSDL
jgi:hypothetical protein